MSVNETLVKRIETCIDRWNQLPRDQRHALSRAVVQASLGLGELGKLHRSLVSLTEELEGKLDRAETASREEEIENEP